LNIEPSADDMESDDPWIATKIDASEQKDENGNPI
jgi:hypothetical protein